MRDPERIDAMLLALREIWTADPDLRLGQLIIIGTKPITPCPEVFYVDDEKLLIGLRNYQESKKGVSQGAQSNGGYGHS